MLDVYVINLAGHDARMEHMRAGLAANGIPFTRVEAVNGKRLSSADLAASYVRLRGERPLLANEVACSLSHKRCWEMLVASEAPAAAIFEDDVHFADGIATVLADTAWLPRDADVVRLETWRRKVALDRTAAAAIGGREVFRLRSVTYGTAAYVITRTAAAKALAAWPKVDCPPDTFLFDPRLKYARSFVLYQMDPAPCIQEMRLPDAPQNLPSSMGERPRLALAAEIGRKLQHLFIGRPREVWLWANILVHGRSWRIAEFG